MKKIIKYSTFSVLGIIVLGIIAVVLLITIVNPNRFKPMIHKAVYQSTGRTITLNGDISWKIYPNLGVTIKDVSLSNPTGFTDANFMTLNSADVSVGLIPLLSKHIVIKTLAIDGLNLALIQKNGVNNWTFSAPQTASTGTNEPVTKPQQLKLDMSSFNFTHTTISYANYDLKQNYSVKDINLNVDTDFGGSIQFDQANQLLNLTRVNLNYNNQAIANFNFKVHNFTNPNYSGDINIIKLTLNQILDQFNIATKPRAGVKLLDNIVFSGNINGDKKNLTLKDFKFNLSNILKGGVNLVLNDFTTPTYRGNFNLDKFNLNQLLDSLDIAVAIRKNKSLLNSFAINSSGFIGDKNNININGLNINLSDLIKISLNNLHVKNFGNPNITGNINIPAFNLNKTLDALDIGVATRKTKPLLNNFAFNSNFNATKTSLALNNAQFGFGKSIYGSSNVTVSNFSNPQYNGILNIPMFSLNNVMRDLGITPPSINNKQLLDQFAAITTFNGTLNSLSLKQLRLKLSNSTVTGSVNVNSFKPLAFNENITVDQMDAVDFVNVKGYRIPMRQLQLVGNANITRNMDFATLNGRQNIQVGNITVLGISLDKLVADLNNTINSASGNSNNLENLIMNSAQIMTSINKMKANIDAATKPGKKDYNQKSNLGTFTGNANINKGLISPSAFKLNGPSVVVSGVGSVNLAGSKAINYKVSSQLLFKDINPLLKKMIFPATVTGTLNQQNASLDWNSIQQQLLRNAIASNKGQIQQTIKEQLNNALGSKKGNRNIQQDKAVDEVSKGVTNAIGKLFGN